MALKIAILGAGAMGLTLAAIAAAGGHSPVIWSPSGGRGPKPGAPLTLQARGALVGQWPLAHAESAGAAIEGADLVVIAVDAAGHAPVMRAAAAHLSAGQLCIISAAHSMSGLYLDKLLAARGLNDLAVMSWNTSAGTAHSDRPGVVDIRVLRRKIEVSVHPAQAAPAALALCAGLFTAEFTLRPDALAIALLSNCNPVFHVPVCLLNIGRIEKAEPWAPYGETTPAIGRLMEALDAERLAIAAAAGISIHSVNAHFHRSFGIDEAPMAVMNAALHARGRGPKGPRALPHRYLAQDIPFGLVFAARIARALQVPTPTHDATIALADAALGHDHGADNPLFDLLGLAPLSPQALLALARDGHRAPKDLPQPLDKDTSP